MGCWWRERRLQMYTWLPGRHLKGIECVVLCRSRFVLSMSRCIVVQRGLNEIAKVHFPEVHCPGDTVWSQEGRWVQLSFSCTAMTFTCPCLPASLPRGACSPESPSVHPRWGALQGKLPCYGLLPTECHTLKGACPPLGGQGSALPESCIGRHPARARCALDAWWHGCITARCSSMAAPPAQAVPVHGGSPWS